MINSGVIFFENWEKHAIEDLYVGGNVRQDILADGMLDT